MNTVASGIHNLDTRSMPTTTIKVDASVRDRLKAEAARKGVTIGALLADLVALSEREGRFAEIKAAISRTPPASMSDYLSEVDLWDAAAPDTR